MSISIVKKKIKSNVYSFIENNGKNNYIFTTEKNLANINNNYFIKINGNNNKLYLNEINGSGKLYIAIDGDDSIFKFGKNNTINNNVSINFWNTSTDRVNNAIIQIGENNIFNGENIKIISPINTKIIIGDNNLFAGDIQFWGRNDHVIYDLNSGIRLNEDKNIEIGDENWICQEVKFLPGARIINKSVIAMGAVVNKNFKKNNILIAGIPAEIKKENIGWSISSNINYIDYNNSIKTNMKGIN